MQIGVRATFVAVFLCLGFAGSGIARPLDIVFFAEVDRRVAEGRLTEAEAFVKTEILISRGRSLDDRLTLYDLLAGIQAARGRHDAQGDTLSDKAALISREFGADSPELPPVYSAAGDAYMAAEAFGHAADSYRAALWLDELFLSCDSPALGASFERYGEALRAFGESEAAAQALETAGDPLGRCGIEAPDATVASAPEPDAAPETDDETPPDIAVIAPADGPLVETAVDDAPATDTLADDAPAPDPAADDAPSALAVTDPPVAVSPEVDPGESVSLALATSRHAVPTGVASLRYTAPEPAVPEPAVPAPAMPVTASVPEAPASEPSAPAASAPVASEPVTSQRVVAAPTAAEPVTPEPVAADPAPTVAMPAAPISPVLSPPTGRSIVVPEDPSEADFARVDLLFGTDRAPNGTLRPATFYGAERGAVDYGQVSVALPRRAAAGMTETPALFTFRWPENPAQHVVITDLQSFGGAGFFERVSAGLSGAESDEIMVFVHGFDTTFAQAARRTAALAYELNFDGVPMFYSWPSAGEPGRYFADAAAARVSARHLAAFLDDLVARSGAGAGRIHLVAQAMGARALAQALELYAARHDGAAGVFGQVILAAPDLDPGLFALQAGTMGHLAERITLYTDRARSAAGAGFSGAVPRPGPRDAETLSGPGFDTIAVSGAAAGPGLLARGTLAAALPDVLWLMWQDADPSARCGLVRSEADGETGGAYWEYRARQRDPELLLPALTLLRRFGPEAPARLADLEPGSRSVFGPGGGVDPGDLETTIEDILRR